MGIKDNCTKAYLSQKRCLTPFWWSQKYVGQKAVQKVKISCRYLLNKVFTYSFLSGIFFFSSPKKDALQVSGTFMGMSEIFGRIFRHLFWIVRQLFFLKSCTYFWSFLLSRANQNYWGQHSDHMDHPCKFIPVKK